MDYEKYIKTDEIGLVSVNTNDLVNDMLVAELQSEEPDRGLIAQLAAVQRLGYINSQLYDLRQDILERAT